MTKCLAIYPGTFDPITNGHLSIIKRGLKVFEHLIVAILHNPQKKPLFTLKERIEMIKTSIEGIPNVEVDYFDGLLIDYAVRKNATVILRGLRAMSDFEYEFQMALMNRKLEDSVETLFMMPSEQYTYLSSRIVKEIAYYGGDIDCLVTPPVARRLREKFGYPVHAD